jgi:hypothetical protein
MSSPGRLWRLLRRDLKHGWSASYHHYRTLPRITEWTWPYWGEEPNPVPVHVLTGADDWLLAAWMLASWFHFTGQNWRVVIHDDGSLPAPAEHSLLRMFRGTQIIRRHEADAEMDRILTAFPFCTDYRKSHPLALKTFDMPHFAAHEKFLIFDSDLLFFKQPAEVMQWTIAGDRECWFNEDVREGSLISAHEALAELGVKLWPHVNSGLCLIHKPALDLDFCDRALAQTSILRGHIRRVEQTLFALCASRHGAGGLLPKTYEVSLSRHAADGIISRHYVGAVRDRFYGEGVRRLRVELLLDRQYRG